ncbi:MAG: PRC-barrel domain protein [Thermoplasmata archaeon]|nr:MAG: PRC-barrel domain protein [Thermoplasmata archaeon]KAA0015983.1 MAG: PRC-barrel domain protein [Thermoplasmata archaeon]MCD6542118.1 PRC-barrel domain-containing protein [Thermoplasmata archaeon]
MRIFENELRGKTVMTEGGLIIGVLRNITMDQRTGELKNLLVEPSEDIDVRLYHLDERGHIVLDFDSVKSVRDVVIVKD